MTPRISMLFATMMVSGCEPVNEPYGGRECVLPFSYDKNQLIGFAALPSPYLDLGRVLLEGKDGRWYISNAEEPINDSFVLKIKQSIGRLCADAEVIRDEPPEKFGLGQDATWILLFFRDGATVHFTVSDPNPDRVSFYLKVENKDMIYVIKRSVAWNDMMNIVSHENLLF